MGRTRYIATCVALTISLVWASIPAPVSAATAVLVGAGDIGACGSSTPEATAKLLDGIRGTVFTTGDNAYPAGTAEQFADCYDPSWGRHLSRTRPSPGNHDYGTADAAGYFAYFTSRAGPADRGYYAYNRGSWRIYSLNSELITAEQIAWLKADLAAKPSRCSLAYWHRPRFSSGKHGNYGPARAFWWPLYNAGVELVINGHDHDYERFAPQRPNGTRYWKGVREFVVGTGGTDLRAFATVRPNSVVRQASAHGVLELRLKDGEYVWRFVSVDGTFTDTGTARCHGKP
jgi:hypothetical protein